jgi:hypothetical protein
VFEGSPGSSIGAAAERTLPERSSRDLWPLEGSIFRPPREVVKSVVHSERGMDLPPISHETFRKQTSCFFIHKKKCFEARCGGAYL